jgi:Tol biopolymer transport system component
MWPAVSPDGKSIVYQSTSSPDPAEKIPNLGLITKGPDGKKQQLPGTGYSPRWLPDSRHIAIFRNNKENPDDYELWIIDSVTGEEKRLTHEDVASPSYTTMPIVPGGGVVDFSSDGKHFVYLDWEKTRNAKLGSIDDEEVTPITDNKDPNVRFYTPLFSPNGKQIAIVSAEEFREKSTRLNWRLLMIENGRVRVIFSSESRIRILNWTPAGNLIFSTLDGPNTDVILISTAGKPSKIVSLTDVYMDTPTLSMDG